MLFTAAMYLIGRRGAGSYSTKGHVASCVFVGIMIDLVVFGIVANYFVACNIAGTSPWTWSWTFLGG